MNIIADMPVSLIDQKINISVAELPVEKKLTLRASMSLPWAQNVRFESYAEFISGDTGTIDLAKQAPVAGSYSNADSMGLISSLRLKSGKLEDVGKNISTDNSIFIDISAECESEKAVIRIERRFIADGILVKRITEPFVGVFYYHPEKPDCKTILRLGGSEGSLAYNLPIASLLASHGYNVLSVAYFSEAGLPKELTEVPLEYFDGVFDWLSANQHTKNKELYLHCTSKGGELGLILASRHPAIKKVAAFAPHAYCFQGISFQKRSSSWTYQGKPLPYVHMKYSTMIADMLACFLKNKPLGYSHTYIDGLKHARNKDEARIKVENAKADLLLFAGKQDNIWNSYDGCKEIIDTLGKAAYPYQYELIAYENAGHPFYAPYIASIEAFTSMKVAPRIVFSNGGDVESNAEAQIDSWERCLEFFGK